jgi:hypothetical protein
MANTLLVSVGSDLINPGKFYWDIKDAFSREVIHVRKGLRRSKMRRRVWKNLSGIWQGADLIVNT